MSKLSKERLVEEVQAELVTFLQSGTIAEDDVISTLDFTDLEIDEFDRLKRIHFCLSDPVVEFVQKLPDRIRGIKTATQRKRVRTRGEVRGSIDWGETTKVRHSESIGDRSVFACESPYVEYDIPENLVLKRLLWIIQQTADQELLEFDYDWRRNQWSDEDIRQFSRRYSRNVHLDRITRGEAITLTRRDLNVARTARDPLYTEAYDLFSTYEQLQVNDFTDPAVQSILRETLVIPERLPRLFELFCVFKLIRVLSELYPGVSLQIIEPGADTLARLQSNDIQINVYHDKTGNLTFREPLPETPAETPFFQRYQEVLEKHVELLDTFLEKDTEPTLYSGRPDIVVEIYDRTTASDLPSRVLLGEIKYTESEQTFSRGLRELLEYVQFARIDRTYLTDNSGIEVHGLLITDGVEANTVHGQVQHVTAEQIQDSAPLWTSG